MIQVATENFNSQEDFLGLGKKNKAKRQEKKAARKEKRAAKKEARQGKGIFGKIANRVGIGKEAKAIRKDHKAAKTQIKTTGSFVRGSVASGTIRKPNTRINIKPSVIKSPSNGGFRGIVNKATGGVMPLPRPVPQIKLPSPQRPPQPKPEQRGGASPVDSQDLQDLQEPQISQSPQSPQLPNLPSYSEMSMQAASAQAETAASPDTAQAAEGQNADPNKKPFNWKLWGGIGGGAVLIIVIILIVVFTKK